MIRMVRPCKRMGIIKDTKKGIRIKIYGKETYMR
jgi:hypothetical protein